MTINFGSINGRRSVTFKVTNDGVVLAAKYRSLDTPSSRLMPENCQLFISARESFRRWKIARKAWRTRKWKNQLKLGL